MITNGMDNINMDLNAVYKEICEYEKNIVPKSKCEKLCNFFKNKSANIKGPLKYEICLTSRCNQKCLHCSNGIDSKNATLKSDWINDVLDQEPVMIVLTGGEPLLYSDIFSIISKIKKRGVFLKICTNAVCLNEDICNKLASLLDEDDVIQISFDASEKKTYARIRGTDDFQKIVANIKIARKILRNITLELHCVPNKFNVCQIIEIFEQSKELQVDVFSTAPLAYLGQAKKEYQADIISLLQIELELYRHSNEHTKYIGRLFEICSLYEVLDVISMNTSMEKKIYRCDAGIFAMYINCTEEVYPCVYLKTSNFCLGYLKDGLQTAIERAKKIFSNGYSIEGTKCENCHLWGVCNGGCIGVAYGAVGEARPGLDPRCSRFNKDGNISLGKGGTKYG